MLVICIFFPIRVSIHSLHKSMTFYGYSVLSTKSHYQAGCRENSRPVVRMYLFVLVQYLANEFSFADVDKTNKNDPPPPQISVV